MSMPELSAFDHRLNAYADTSRPPLNAVLVLRNGAIISEHYWHGFTATSYQHIFSVTKSVVSALVGLAVADGKLRLTDTLAQWFPELNFRPGTHPTLVTIHHLLTMTAGFQRQTGRITAQDAIATLLRRDSVALPGEKFQYSNDDVDLLAVVLERAVGESVADYAHKRLFAPLGVWRDLPKSARKRLWKTDKQKHTKGSHGLHLNAHELAAFGQLYLQGGKWQNEQLLPPDFVAASTTEQSCGGYPEQVRYGYLWWIATTPAGYPAFFASGAGGQYVYVVPSLEVVLVILTSTSRLGDGRRHRVMIVQFLNDLLASANCPDQPDP